MKLSSLLWIDFSLGFIAGVTGLIFFNSLEGILKIPGGIIMTISVVTVLYSLLALFSAQRISSGERLIKSLVIANWLWAVVSVVLLFLYYSNASVFGKLYLVLQIAAVAGLAYFEGKALNNLSTQYR